MSHNTTICTHDAGEMAPTFVKNKLQLSILVVYLKFKGFFFSFKRKKEYLQVEITFVSSMVSMVLIRTYSLLKFSQQCFHQIRVLAVNV